MSVSEKVNKIISSLNDRGLNKWSNEVSEVKDAMLFTTPEMGQGSPWKPLGQRGLLGDRNKPEHTPTDPNVHPYNDGDFVLQLNPSTKTEEPMMWNAKKNRLVPINEVADMVDKGTMREERVFDQYENAQPELKAKMQPLVTSLRSKRPFSNMAPGEVGIPYYPMQKMAYISDCLEKRGYTLLVKKLKTAMEEYKNLISDNS